MLNQNSAQMEIPKMSLQPSGEEIHQGWFRKINGPRIHAISGEDCVFGDDDKLWDEIISLVNSGNAEGHALRAI
ncbi:MAG: hypothetical protein R3E02_04020 [Blastomonas sp.]